MLKSRGNYYVYLNIDIIHTNIGMHCDRSVETFSSHVWILTKLLEQPNCLKILLSYVVGACHKKINNRVKKKSKLSDTYFKYFLQTESFRFEEILTKGRDTNSINQSDVDLLSSLCRLPKKVQDKFPKLRKLAELSAANPSQPYTLYIQDTHWEFHSLLCELLQLFRDALEQLSLTTSKSKTQASPDFQNQLSKVVLYGYALQRMVKSSGLSQYLQNLTASSTRPHKQDVNVETTEAEPEDSEECDVDLQAVQPYAPDKDGNVQPLWVSCKNWLKLILVHFESVEILSQFTATRHDFTGVSIQILSVPPIHVNLLAGWKEVLKNPSYFPLAMDGHSNDEIIRFLTKGANMPPNTTTLVNTFQKKFDAFMNGTLETLPDIKPLAEIAMKFQPQWQPHVEKIATAFEDLSTPKLSLNVEALAKEVNKNIQLLHLNATFFHALQNWNVRSFKGSQHCEASIVSLLAGLSNKSRPPNMSFKHLLNDLKVTLIVLKFLLLNLNLYA